MRARLDRNQQCLGFVGAEFPCCAATDELLKELVEPVHGSDPHLDELLTALDEQPQDRHDVVELHVLRVRGAQRRQLRLSASAERTG